MGYREKKAAAKAQGRQGGSSDEDDSDGADDESEQGSGEEQDPFFQHEDDPFSDPFFKVAPTAHAYMRGHLRRSRGLSDQTGVFHLKSSRFM